MSRRHFTTTPHGSVDCCVETPLVNISTVAAAAASTSLPMSPPPSGQAAAAIWLDPSQWSPYRVRRSSYLIATQDAPPAAPGGSGSTRPSQPEVAGMQSATPPESAATLCQSPIYEDRLLTTLDRDFDLPALLPLPLPSPGEPWTPTSAESLSPMPTPRHWDSLALGNDGQQELEISSPDCPTASGSVGNHVSYSGRNALLMIAAAAGENDAITTVESGETGWCNACRADPAKATPEAEVMHKTTMTDPARQPANAVRNLVVVCLSCVLVQSGFRSAECLEASLNDAARLGVVSLCLMHAAAAGTCYIAPVMVSRLGAKWTMVAGVAFYVVWLVANCAPHPCTMLPAAASVGLGESLLWTAQVSLTFNCRLLLFIIIFYSIIIFSSFYMHV